MKRSFGHAAPPQQPLSQARQMISWDGLRQRGVFYHESYLRRMWEADPPRFPRPFKPSPRKLCWFADEVDSWIAKAAKQKGIA